jgi:VanZ family protein
MNIRMIFSSKRYTPLFLIFLVIFIVAYFMPIGINIHNLYFLNLHLDYIFHSLFSFTLFFLFIGSFDYSEKSIHAIPLLISILTLVVFINSLEIIQMFTPHRSFDWKDIISNITGMFFGTMSQLFIVGIIRLRGKEQM